MSAEISPERLAELIAYAEQCSKPWIGVEVPNALRELQAYRAKRETHVWVPKVPTEAMIAAAESAYMSQPKPMLPWADAYRAMLDARETDNV